MAPRLLTNMVDAALLELEGVLFDTRSLRRSSMRDALREHGLNVEVDLDAIDGLSTHEAATAAMRAARVSHDDVLADLVRMTAERLFASRLSTTGVALTPGALDFVRESVAQARLVAVTRARRSEAEALLRLASLDEFISTIVTADDVVEGKPAIDGYRRAMERLDRARHVDERSVIAIEDAASGIRAARRAGIRCVAVGPLPAHVAIEADAYVESLVGQSVRTLDLLSRPGRERVQ
jgi:HAD superfamily hydrolase (TIGR01509 family)